MTRTIIALLLLATGALAGGMAEPEGHPFLLPYATPAADFPLYSDDDLALHGYPDHQHVYFWPGWTPPLDVDGEPYGFGSFCRGLHSVERPGFTTAPGRIAFAPFVLAFKQDAEPCLVAPFLGFCEMSLLDVRDRLGLEPEGELIIVSPDDTDAYTSATGFGTWRMYDYDAGVATVQPVGILARRTLIAHAATDMVVRWALDTNGGAVLPTWFREGLAAWTSEMGVHLCNYMAAFRLEGEVLMAPEAIESYLSGEPHKDLEADRKLYRMARYGAFLMVWRLVEHHGGLANVQDLLAAVRDGRDPSDAARDIYGLDFQALAETLDPRAHPEPIGAAVQPRNPSRPPRTGP